MSNDRVGLCTECPHLLAMRKNGASRNFPLGKLPRSISTKSSQVLQATGGRVALRWRSVIVELLGS